MINNIKEFLGLACKFDLREWCNLPAGKSITEYFIGQGIAESRISYGGFGFSKPLLDNALPEGRMINRRVELSVWYLVGDGKRID